MSIESELSTWDKKSASSIAAIYQRYKDDKQLIEQLIQLMTQKEHQIGATWLIKHALENGDQIHSNQAVLVFEKLPLLDHWESKLHVLQCLRHLPIARSELKAVETFIRKALTSSNKLLRAWAYSGFYELSRQFPEYAEETRQLFQLAMQDEAASVKARIRNIMKTGF